MAEKRLLEFVCTGNNGRSPIAELIARNHLAQIKADSNYSAISSGLKVDYTNQFLAGNVRDDSNMTKLVIDAGRQSQLYTPEDIARIDRALREGNNDVLLQYAISVSSQLMTAERKHMRELLVEMGIPGEVKPGRDQTIVRPDAIVVLAMDKKGKSGVESIYMTVPRAPVIDILPHYATGGNHEVVNAFGKGRDVYRATIEQLAREVPLAVNRAVGA